MSAAIKAGKAAVEIIATNKTEAGIRSSLASFKGMASGLSSAAAMVSSVVAAIGSSAVIGAAKHFADTGSAIHDMSARTGVAAGELQLLKFAAEQSGASLADVETGLRRMAKNGMNTKEFQALGQKLAAIVDPSERAAAALEAFGKSGTKLIPMFQDFAALKASSEALGPVLTSEEVARADELGDAMGALVEASSRAAQQIGSKLAPALQDALEIATGLTVEFSKWVSGSGEMGGLVETLEGVLESGGGGLLGMLYSDRIAEFLRGAERAGEAGNVGSDKAAAEQAAAMAEEAAENEKFIAEAQQRILDTFLEFVNDAKTAIKEFETPAEKFTRRMHELAVASQRVNEASQLGAVNAVQRNQIQFGLQDAMGRLRKQEQERIEKSLKQVQKKTEKQAQAEIINGSRGTFSAAGAGMLGFGSDILVRDPENKVHTKQLIGIQKVLDERLFVAKFG